MGAAGMGVLPEVKKKAKKKVKAIESQPGLSESSAVQPCPENDPAADLRGKPTRRKKPDDPDIQDLDRKKKEIQAIKRWVPWL